MISDILGYTIRKEAILNGEEWTYPTEVTLAFPYDKRAYVYAIEISGDNPGSVTLSVDLGLGAFAPYYYCYFVGIVLWKRLDLYI